MKINLILKYHRKLWGKNNMALNLIAIKNLRFRQWMALWHTSGNESQRDRRKRRMIFPSSFHHHQDSAKVVSFPMSPRLNWKSLVVYRWFDNWQIQMIIFICLPLCIFPFLIYINKIENNLQIYLVYKFCVIQVI